MKIIVLILLAAIVASLASGLVFLARDKQDSRRMQYAFRVRVALSIVLIVFLVSAFLLGWIS